MERKRTGKGRATPEAAFGRVLQRLRRERRLTQEELAEASGCHRSYVSFLERGLKSPTLNTLFDLAAALGTSPTEMVADAERDVLAPPAAEELPDP